MESNEGADRRPTPDEARAALADDAAARRAVADAVRHGPRWYAPLYGLCCGLLVLGLGMPTWVAGLGLLAVSTVGLGIIVGAYAAQTGLTFGLQADGPTRAVVVTGVLLVLACALSALLGKSTELWWAPLVLAPLVGIACWRLCERQTSDLVDFLERSDVA